MTRVLVIALQEVTRDLIDPWVEQGLLPNMAALMRAGTCGYVRAQAPLITPHSLANVLTGVDAGRHGVFDYWQRGADGTFRETSGTSLLVAPIWELLRATGLRSTFLNVPLTWPLPNVDGTVVAGGAAASSTRKLFSRGELQLINKIDVDAFDRLQKENPGIVRSLGASLDSEFIWFNQSPVKTLPEWKRAWFTSAVFRKAVSGAIRRDDMARIVFRGHAHPAVGPISAANRFWVNAALKPMAADAASSKTGSKSDRYPSPLAPPRPVTYRAQTFHSAARTLAAARCSPRAAHRNRSSRGC